MLLERTNRVYIGVQPMKSGRVWQLKGVVDWLLEDCVRKKGGMRQLFDSAEKAPYWEADLAGDQLTDITQVMSNYLTKGVLNRTATVQVI